MMEILLPIWEIMQAVFRIALDISFGLLGKQDRESYMYQNRTVRKICILNDVLDIELIIFLYFGLDHPNI
jgi:hypothetical protein